jgi:tetratricopeptide (TPR) repeat protein
MGAADDAFAEAARAAEAAHDVFLEALSCAYLVWVARERGNPAAEQVPLERSQALLSRVTDPWERSEVLLGLSGGNWDPTTLQEIVELKRQTGDVIATSDTLNNVGWAALGSNDFERATATLEEAVEIARELGDTFRLTLAACNLGLAAVLQEHYAEAVEPLTEALILSIRRGDRRCGAEAILGLATAVAGLGEDELSVQLDAIQRALNAEAGIVYEPVMMERLEPVLSLARERIRVERVTALEATVGAPTMERALELLGARENAGGAA